MNVLIIGGGGYIGSRLVSFLKNEDVTIIKTSRNKSDTTSTKTFYMDYDKISNEFLKKYKIVIMLAGQDDTEKKMKDNLVKFNKFVDKLTKNHVFIYMSSAKVYGDKLSKEDDLLPSPRNYYDFTKQTIDKSMGLSELNYYGLRLGSVNGFSENFREDMILNSMVKKYKNSGEIEMYNKSSLKSVLSIMDLCKTIRCIIEKNDYKKRGIYNIASFYDTVRNITNKVSNKLQAPVNEKTKSGERISFKMDTGKFERVFEFKFEDTVETIIDDILENWDNIKTVKNHKDKKEDYIVLKDCMVCKSEIKQLLDLKEQPLANDCHTQNEILKKYPLGLNMCKNCYHVQLNISVNPDILFKNYLYVSGTSNTSQEYFYEFAKTMLEKYKTMPQKVIKILDIACNDGTQLDAFVKVGKELNIKIETIGIDPAYNLECLSNDREHKIITEYFDENVSHMLKETFGTFDIIICQNVFAHINYPSEFLQYCKVLMSDETLLYIQTSQAKMILNNEFDTAYHEHLGFFNGNSMNILCKRNDLVLINIEHKSIHGTSYLFTISKDITQNIRKTTEFIYKEMEQNLYDDSRYETYVINCLLYRNNFVNKILGYKLKNYNIIGWGCTAKSSVLLNFSELNNKTIDYIIDENPLKIGLLTPGSDIQIQDKSILNEINSPTVLVVFAWNFHDEIVKKAKNILSQEQLKYVKFLKIN